MLSQEEFTVYKDVQKLFKASDKIPCTGCHYCMPCPHGVDIPSCFSAYNTYCSINKSQGAMQYMMGTLIASKPSYAGLCKKCGKCEKHCPQHIPIIKSLEEVSGTMEKFRFKIMAFGTKIFVKKK